MQGLPSMYTESVGNFYSPLASPNGSLYRIDAGGSHPIVPVVKFSHEQVSVIIFQDSIV